jgi:hypothetical protein
MLADHNYQNLLTNLHRHPNRLPLDALQSSITHYITYIEPSPTPLAASVISSPFFLTSDQSKLHALVTAFRHAVQLKHESAVKEVGGIFSPGVTSRMSTWAKAVLDGLQGGHPLLRLACACGLLQGMEDIRIRPNGRNISARGKTESEVVLSFAAAIGDASRDVWGRGSDERLPLGKWYLYAAYIRKSCLQNLRRPCLSVAIPYPWFRLAG